MKVEVSTGIEELKRQFSASAFTVREDGQGGAYVVMEPCRLGPRYRPEAPGSVSISRRNIHTRTSIRFSSGRRRPRNGVAFAAPVTPGHNLREAGDPGVAPKRSRTKRLAKGRRQDLESAGFPGEAAMNEQCRLRIARQDFNVS